jgi:protein SCO1/2
MTKKINIKWVVLFAIMVLPIFVYLTFVYSARENFFVTLDYLEMEGTEEPYSIPDFQFTNQDGQLISNKDLKGQIYVATFFFSTCPSICPAMNFHLKELQDRFKGYPDFKLISFTVDPERDTPEVLRAYATKLGADTDGWHFLTGDREDLYKTAGDFFISAMEDATADGGYLHSESAIIVDWDGKLRSRRDDLGNLVGSYDVLSPTALKELKEDLRVLIAEYEKFKSRKDKDESR